MSEPADRESGAAVSGAGRTGAAAATRVATEAAPRHERGGAGGSDIFTLFNALLIAANMISGPRNLQGSLVS